VTVKVLKLIIVIKEKSKKELWVKGFRFEIKA